MKETSGIEDKKREHGGKGDCDAVRRLMMLIGCCHLYYLTWCCIQVISLVMYERYSQSGARRPSHSIQRAFVFSNAVAQVLVFISSGCNPILYGIFNKNYRQSSYCCFVRIVPNYSISA